MKAALASALLAASAVQAGLIAPATDRIDWNFEQKRQIIGTLTTLIGKGGKVADPPGAAPKRQDLPATSKVPGAKRVKMRYGPYSVPNMNKTSLVGEAGALWNYPDTSIAKPCTECVILGQQAGLEFPNGKNANIDSGMWLHHMVQFNTGPGRQDPTCFNKPSMPHVDVGTSPQNSERYFSSGNERTHVQLDINGAETKAGYQINARDRFAFIVDLMNMNMEDKTVYLTMYYDILPGKLPAGWKDVKPVWFDANQCGTSEVSAKKQSGSYNVPSGTWKPNFDGEVIVIGGHLHDGGVVLQTMTDGKVNCDSTASYAETSEYVFAGQKMGGASGMADKHISRMTACYTDKVPIRKLSPDQSWSIVGRYDYDKFPGNKNHGRQSSVMAIAIMYVAVEPGTTLRGSSSGGAGMPKGMGGMKGAPKAPGSSTPAAPPAAAPAAPAAAPGVASGAGGRQVAEPDSIALPLEQDLDMA